MYQNIIWNWKKLQNFCKLIPNINFSWGWRWMAEILRLFRINTLFHVNSDYLKSPYHTNLGSLISSAQYGHFRIFLPLNIVREMNFGPFDAPKTVILTIWAALNFKFLENFVIFICEIFPKMVKWQFWPFKISQNWIRVKSKWQENC